MKQFTDAQLQAAADALGIPRTKTGGLLHDLTLALIGSATPRYPRMPAAIVLSLHMDEAGSETMVGTMSFGEDGSSKYADMLSKHIWPDETESAKVEGPKRKPVAELLERFRQDRHYMFGWHANLAMATYDALSGDTELSHDQRWELGQEAARRFLGVLSAGEERIPDMFSNDELRNGLRDAESSNDPG